ncbi:MAG: nuclear transport factor 2 family protein [Deltaproteobacteria bacterium]|nr:nuclear transport factor 2 family protein [Deltaproteobacteria bacterium]
MTELAGRFRSAIDALNARGLDALDELLALYDAAVVFEDPMQKIEGIEAFAELNRKMIAHARSLRFDVHEVVEQNEQLFATWTLHYAPRLGPSMKIGGATHVRVRDGRIVEHRDYWDLMSSVVDVIPGASRVYKSVMARFV